MQGVAKFSSSVKADQMLAVIQAEVDGAQTVLFTAAEMKATSEMTHLIKIHRSLVHSSSVWPTVQSSLGHQHQQREGHLPAGIYLLALSS